MNFVDLIKKLDIGILPTDNIKVVLFLAFNLFVFMDVQVKPVELERVLSKGAYMLLYSR